MAAPLPSSGSNSSPTTSTFLHSPLNVQRLQPLWPFNVIAPPSTAGLQAFVLTLLKLQVERLSLGPGSPEASDLGAQGGGALCDKSRKVWCRDVRCDGTATSHLEQNEEPRADKDLY